MKIKHVFFDLDHTLWDFEFNSEKTFAHIFEQNNLDLDFNDFMKKYRPINHRYWKLFREEKVSKSDLRYNRLKETFNELNFRAENYLINQLAEQYLDYLPTNKTLFEGAFEVLEYLNKKYQLHIITNGFEEVQHQKIKNAKISPYFDKIITSEKAGVKKPNPRIFNYAMELSRAIPNESIMIGDNFEADILGAKAVGMHTIFCEFNGEIATEEVLSISKLIELKQYL
ncbi:MAG: YjjG family noncanonical pyrimidine nucleotidase [Bacteroidota bacterium]